MSETAAAVAEAEGGKTPSPPDDGTTLSAQRPFPGLRPFVFADRGFFFGRERQSFALYRLVEGGRFIAVIGSSGSGKSSLVLAGLQRLLAEETAETSGPSWAFLDMRPGAAPIARLARALGRLSEGESPDAAARRRDRIEWTLRQSSFSFEQALEAAGGLNGRSLLLVVDQFEELFRFGLAGLAMRRTSLADVRARDEATQFVQILLDADRRRLKDVHVLITMRSDFVGDCSYFHGLSEAVSATQYLVPNLIRSQLEDVIRKPVEKAGASIEPELVERLINDCGDELDQLPVLQHCLMRLWDRAGVLSGGGSRALTRQTYDDIGRIAEALSRHADETLQKCMGREIAAEQAFRALSELDREGRAIRRGRRFKTLLAEAGVSEADLRAVLDTFRAPSCSFLVPPLATPVAEDDVVDIGHEALLRRWKVLAGGGAARSAADMAGRSGWLAEERADGDRYRTLLSFLDGEKASLTAPQETKAWWDRRPRTPAWAERYGGKFDEVKALIEESIEAQRSALEQSRRSRLYRWITGLVAAAAVVAAVVAPWIMHVQEQNREAARLVAEQQREAAQQRQRQEEIDKSAMTSAKTLVEKVLQAFDDKSLDPAGAESLGNISGQFLNDIRAAVKTPAADLVWTQALNAQADLQAKLRHNKESLALALQAKAAAIELGQSNPTSREQLRALYDATIRAGNILALKPAQQQDALREYRQALEIGERLAALDGGEASAHAAVDARLKIGDVDSQTSTVDAETDYAAALLTCDAALVKSPRSPALLRDRANGYVRIAQVAGKQQNFEKAGILYAQAIEILQSLVERNAQAAASGSEPLDLTLKSNLAASYRHWGLLKRDAGELSEALALLKKSVALDEGLLAAQPGSLQWGDFVSSKYRTTAEILDRMNRSEEALDYYRKYFEAQRALAYRGLGPPDSQKDFANAARLFGDRASGLDQIDAYRAAVRMWGRLVDDPKFADYAGGQYEAALSMAQVFDLNQDWPDARAAYRVAAKMATLNLVKDPSNASWREKAARAEQASVEAEIKGKAANVSPP